MYFRKQIHQGKNIIFVIDWSLFPKNMSLKGTNVNIVKIIIITVAIIIMKMDFNVGLATLKEKRGGIQNRFVN